ncbi:hypothetical protein DMM94_07730 [Neisseria gonorrhoeae]
MQLNPSFPRRRESRLVRTETYRAKRFLRFHVLDSRLRGNDESIHTETCTTSFPRKWEFRTQGLSNCFYLISFCADRSRFPPARE